MSARTKKILELLKSSEQIVENSGQNELECNNIQRPESPGYLEPQSSPQDNPGPSGDFNYSNNILQKPDAEDAVLQRDYTFEEDSDDSIVDPNYVAESDVLSESDEDELPLSNIKKKMSQQKLSIQARIQQTPAETTTRRKRKMQPKEKQCRKRVRNESEWIDVKAKKELNSGREHRNRKGKLIPARKMKNPCPESCRSKCTTRVTEEKRMEIFDLFWKIANHTKQWEYIAKLVTLEDKKVTKRGISRRNFSRKYNFFIAGKKVQVCKKIFLNTHGISEQWVTTALSRIEETSMVKEDTRGKHENRPQKLNENLRDSVRDHVNMFPVVPSHYIRKNSNKMYLEDGLNICKMHRMYLTYMQEEHSGQQVATMRQYREIFNTEFNIGFFKPKKDQCDRCVVYAMASDNEKKELESEYQQHIQNKEEVRNLKDNDKLQAVEDKTICVACFDLQKVLITPACEISSFYYKSKLATYNFTIYDLGNNKGHCYVWNESIARRGPNEISSCLLNFIKKQTGNGVKKIVFYSDNCGGQNRNRFVFSMFAHASKTIKVQILHRFLERGHTQNEGDSMHATIESAKKRQSNIFTPAQWIMLIKMAKVTGQPYDVKEMSQNDFYSFSNIVQTENWTKDKSGEKFMISKVKQIEFLTSQPDVAEFKYHFTEEPQSICLKRRPLRKDNVMENISILYREPLPIETKKLTGLLELCKSKAIPSIYHPFYYSLKAKDKETKRSNKSAQNTAKSDEEKENMTDSE
ncbi:unnamed protein product [Ceutorhynchus assimilis]|uniref:DUF7869 domain-containing protein n=1 Tax=Ceutorhynchus assimilis TaxID=467358 RepID=A0A9N9MY23_9CUCU|nr:unnamed protein product [Ceutorhynchus assimilis]